MDGKQAHLDWQNLSIRLLLTLIAPVSIALAFDWLLTTFPIVTMIVGLLCIPLATVVVVRTALSELDRVIVEVAPPDPAVDEIPSVDGDGLPDASA